MLICLSVISLFTSGTNNIITSMLPLYYKDKANAGLLAEMLNGCCYVGSTLSSYGLGLIADNEVRTKNRLKYLRIYDIVFFVAVAFVSISNKWRKKIKKRFQSCFSKCIILM